jgi:uncharacterized membrane protein YgcG
MPVGAARILARVRLRRGIAAAAGIAAAVAAAVWLARSPRSAEPPRHVYDEAAVLPAADIPRFEDYLRWILQESDVDVRLLFVNGTRGRSLEDLAVARMREYAIGGRNGERRGVLMLYDCANRRLRIEVGYGLEPYFPDSFVGYLMREHAQMFFASGETSLGIRLMLRLLQSRIRDAVLGNEFDPKAVEALRAGAQLSGGAGAAAAMPASQARGSAAGTLPDRSAFGPQATPDAAYRRYLSWMSGGVYDPRIELFTSSTQTYLAQLPMSRAYFEWIFLNEYGKAYRIAEQDTLAVLYFTDTPFVAPYFFERKRDGWRMDIAAAVRNTMEYTGGRFSWGYRRIEGDPYTRAFGGLLTTIGGVVRFADGDNRVIRTATGR